LGTWHLRLGINFKTVVAIKRIALVALGPDSMTASNKVPYTTRSIEYSHLNLMFLPSEGCYRSIKKNEDTYTLYFAVQGLMDLENQIKHTQRNKLQQPPKAFQTFEADRKKVWTCYSRPPAIIHLWC
jgi:hypothetical protein